MNIIEIKNISEITNSAREFISLIKDERIIAFYGGMGAGKTTFIKAICDVLGVEDIVCSPTFTIVNEYRSTDMPIFHFDFYRIERLQEVLDLGFEDYIYSDGLCLMEWPEKIEDVLPEETLKVELKVNDDDTRSIIIH